MAASRPVPEAALAALLADVLADRAFWREFESASSAPRNAAVAKRAVDLYLATGAFIEENRNLDPADPVARAVAALREIADWAVLTSYASSRIRKSEVVPPRRAFEWLIRVDDVDVWAAALGHRLSLSKDTGLPEEVWPESDLEDLEVGEVIEGWATFSRAYARVLDQLRDPSLQAAWAERIGEGGDSVEEWREGAAQLIYAARGVLGWAHGNLPVNVQPLAIVGLLMAEGVFTAAWKWPEDGLMSPDPDLLSEVLRESDALDWLSEHGGEIPEWLN